MLHESDRLTTHLFLWDLHWYPQHEFPHAAAQPIRRFPRHIGFTPDKLWMPCIKQDTSPNALTSITYFTTSPNALTGTRQR